MGKGITIIFTMAFAAGTWLLFHPVQQREATLEFWVFARTHYQGYISAVDRFEAAHPGVTVDLQLVDHRAIANRLQSAFWADLDTPDLVEMDIGGAGVFSRGPIDQAGFADLRPWLESSGYLDRFVSTRLAPYTNRGRIFGIPHDVHPVMLAYRKDLFEAEGIDVSRLATWEDFMREAHRITIPNQRYMLELSNNTSAHFEMFLFQRGGGYFDATGNLMMDNALALDTLLWYVPLIAGPERISASLEGGGGIGMGQIFTQAIENDYVLCFLCPDWRVQFIETDAPRMKGKMALAPLPAFEPGGRNVSTFGGTMLGISKKCAAPELARELAQALYLDKKEVAVSFRALGILPAFKDAWAMPEYHQANPYWSGQCVGEAFINVAGDVPPQHTSAYLDTAKIAMGSVIASCGSYYSKYGAAGFQTFAEQRLKEAAQDVRRAMTRDPFREDKP